MKQNKSLENCLHFYNNANLPLIDFQLFWNSLPVNKCILQFSKITFNAKWKNNWPVTHEKVEDAESEHVEWETHVAVVVEPVQHPNAQTEKEREEHWVNIYILRALNMKYAGK